MILTNPRQKNSLTKRARLKFCICKCSGIFALSNSTLNLIVNTTIVGIILKHPALTPCAPTSLGAPMTVEMLNCSSLTSFTEVILDTPIAVQMLNCSALTSYALTSQGIETVFSMWSLSASTSCTPSQPQGHAQGG